MFRPAFPAFCISLSLIASGLPSAARSANYTSGSWHQSADEPALRAVIEQYFAAFAQEDLEAITRLWSEKSPDLAAGKSMLRNFFSANNQIEVKELRLRQLAIEGDRASLIATAEVNAIDVRTGKPALVSGKMSRAISFVKEAGEWKLWREVLAEDELAPRLIAANNDEKGASILAEDNELLTPALCNALFRAGERFRFREDYEQAMTAYRLMQYVAERIGSNRLIAAALHNVAVVHDNQGEYAQALESAQKSLKLKEEIDNKASFPTTLWVIGDAHMNQGNYARAMQYFWRMLTTSEELGDKVMSAKALAGISAVHYYQGNWAMALDYDQRSLAIYKEADNKMGASSELQSIGDIHLARGDYAAALDSFRENLAILEGTGHNAGVAHVLRDIGRVYSAEGDHFQAMGNYERALALSEGTGARQGTADILRLMAFDYLDQGKYEKAIEHARRSADLERQMGSLWRLADSLTCAGQAHLALGRADEARRAFEEAIAAIETLRAQVVGGEEERQRYFEKRISPYYSIVALLISQNKPGEALAYAERAKGRVLLDVLHNGRTNITKTMTSEEREREKRLAQEIGSLNKQIVNESARSQPNQTRTAELKASLEQARLNHKGFQTRLYAAHPELRIKRGEAQPLKAEEAATLLTDSNTALIEYAVTEYATYLFVLTRAANKTVADLKLYSIPVKRKELASLVDSFRQKLASHNLLIREPATRVYELLLKPAQEQLKGKAHVVIVPDDVLWELPFQAAVTSAGRYFIEESAVSYAPSLTVLREMVARRNKRARPADETASLLALGNPTPSKATIERVKFVRRDEALQPLPEAEREVKTLGQLYGATQSKVFIGSEAREDRAKAEAGTFKVLHFATHGVLNNASPMYSHLVLSQGEGSEDGLLEAWELMNMDLRADLVVLSACETARGRVGAGEGMIGLSWALFVAGSPTTVVSQWKVDSASTSELMLEFHRNYRSSGSKAEGLRKAMLKLLRSNQYKHPFYWAPFVIIGDGN